MNFARLVYDALFGSSWVAPQHCPIPSSRYHKYTQNNWNETVFIRIARRYGTFASFHFATFRIVLLYEVENQYFIDFFIEVINFIIFEKSIL